jgi:hypothetical protein
MPLKNPIADGFFNTPTLEFAVKGGMEVQQEKLEQAWKLPGLFRVENIPLVNAGRAVSQLGG